MRLELTMWLFALAFSIIGGISVFTGGVGRWALPVGSGFTLALGLMRYRVELEQKKRHAGDQND